MDIYQDGHLLCALAGHCIRLHAGFALDGSNGLYLGRRNGGNLIMLARSMMV
jgi:hypothetical protein